ncbi:MAG: ArsR/SmtB family transcription factor [Candidatus Merdivicinus sp.]|jgi:predicted transcriptional regulator
MNDHMEIRTAPENAAFFEALGSGTRLQILTMLADGPRSISDLAEAMKLSVTITARHIRQLEEAGIVRTVRVPGKRGMQRRCELAISRCTAVFGDPRPEPGVQRLSIPVGQYCDYDVAPTCGLASVKKQIGITDDPQYFSSPERLEAGILWFGSGYVRYPIPGYLFRNQPVRELRITLELCSEYPGFRKEWPSDIAFSLNGREIGTFTSPGDFGVPHGVYTPSWWRMGTQYGLLKTISLNNTSSRIDGITQPGIFLRDFLDFSQNSLLFTIACSREARNCGGVTLFGRGFGNYDTDIEVEVVYGE